MAPVLLNPATPQITALAASSADPFLILLNYGGLGILALLFVTGRVSSKPEVDYLKKQLEERDKLIEALRVQLTDRTIPALARVTEAVTAGVEDRREAASLAHLEALVGRVERVLGDAQDG